MSIERIPIEESHILMFCRAIGDVEDPPVAPPTFIQSSAQFDPNYGLRPKPGTPWPGSGRNATGLPPKDESSDGGDGGSGGGMARGLHAEQHFTFHRHIRPGDVLSATTRPGESWTKEGRRGGTLRFSESITEYRDADGELVITARGVGVQTGKAVE